MCTLSPSHQFSSFPINHSCCYLYTIIPYWNHIFSLLYQFHIKTAVCTASILFTIRKSVLINHITSIFNLSALCCWNFSIVSLVVLLIVSLFSLYDVIKFVLLHSYHLIRHVFSKVYTLQYLIRNLNWPWSRERMADGPSEVTAYWWFYSFDRALGRRPLTPLTKYCLIGQTLHQQQCPKNCVGESTSSGLPNYWALLVCMLNHLHGTHKCWLTGHHHFVYIAILSSLGV